MAPVKMAESRFMNALKNLVDSARTSGICLPMELDLENEFADRAYPILASLVTPRPIALVTTLSPEGVVNVAPFSFFNVFRPSRRSSPSPWGSRRRFAEGQRPKHPPQSRVRREPRG